MSALAVAAVDGGIASLQRLRERIGGAQDADEEPDELAGRPVRRGSRERHGAEADTPEITASLPAAPRPRRLRSVLLALCLMLAGGTAGMTLAYNMLAQLLERRAATIGLQQAELSKYAKSVAGLGEKLELQQAQRSEAEARLAALIAENKLAGQRTSRQEPGSRGGADAPGSGVCTLDGSNVRAALIGCIDEMNRQ